MMRFGHAYNVFLNPSAIGCCAWYILSPDQLFSMSHDIQSENALLFTWRPGFPSFRGQTARLQPAPAKVFIPKEFFFDFKELLYLRESSICRESIYCRQSGCFFRKHDHTSAVNCSGLHHYYLSKLYNWKFSRKKIWHYIPLSFFFEKVLIVIL